MGKQLEVDGFETPLLVLLGLIVAAPGESFADRVHGFLPNATGSRARMQAELVFEDSRAATGRSIWTARFSYSEGSTHPARIELLRGDGKTEFVRAELVLHSVQREAHMNAAGCYDPLPWSLPRVPLRLLTDQDVPANTPIPPEYPMNQAYEDARDLPQMQMFISEHPGTRMVEMYISSYASTVVAGGASQWTLEWRVTFGSPADQVWIEAYVRRHVLTPSGLVTDGVGGVGEPGTGPAGLAPDPVWLHSPMITLDTAVDLARDAGLDLPNRTGWNESPILVGPHWRVEHYDPEYGSAPDSTRTAYWFDPYTGWLSFSAINDPVA